MDSFHAISHEDTLQGRGLLGTRPQWQHRMLSLPKLNDIPKLSHFVILLTFFYCKSERSTSSSSYLRSHGTLYTSHSTLIHQSLPLHTEDSDLHHLLGGPCVSNSTVAPSLSNRWASSVRHGIWHLSQYLTRATPSMYKEDWNVGVVSPPRQLKTSSTQTHPLRELKTDSTTEQRRTTETHTARVSELLWSQAHSLWQDRKIANTS